MTWVYASSIRHGGKLFLESEYTANLRKTNAEIEIKLDIENTFFVSS